MTEQRAAVHANGCRVADPDTAGASPTVGHRVLIDALAARFGGAAYAAVQLAKHLASRREPIAVSVITRGGSIVDRGLVDERRVRRIVLRTATHAELPRRVVWETARLPRLVDRERFDLVVTTSGMLPRAITAPSVCLLFNPIMYECDSLANRLRREAVRRTASRAKLVIAPSQYMAELVTASTGCACAVVPLGIDQAVFSPAPSPGQEVLCVSDFYAHKRHELVLDAWLRLPAPRPTLRLIGRPDVDPGAHARLMQRIRRLPDRVDVVVECAVTLERLLQAYRSARVFVLASERESFGIPLLESLACGVPAVVRDLPSLRETAGTAATYVAGDDPERWAAAVQLLLADDAEHRRARELAIEAARRFSWDTLASAVANQL